MPFGAVLAWLDFTGSSSPDADTPHVRGDGNPTSRQRTDPPRSGLRIAISAAPPYG
jgi:hypothetical protein